MSNVTVNRHASVVGVGGLHVEHVVHAVHLLLERVATDCSTVTASAAGEGGGHMIWAG